MEKQKNSPSTLSVSAQYGELERRLDLFDATMIIVGNIIGIGIFTTTGLIAEALPDAMLIIWVWIIGGLLTLCGALTYAELGAAMPRAGGEYVYLKEAYGPLYGFLNGWTYFFVINPGSIAAMAVGLIFYLERFWPGVSLGTNFIRISLLGQSLALSTGQVVAFAIVFFFSTINYCGVRSGSLVQNVLTVAKLGAILAISVLGLINGGGSWNHFSSTHALVSSADFLNHLSLAMIAVVFAFTGWFTSTYVASEIKEPQRNVPCSIIYGTLIVMGVYVLINIAYVYALPIDQMRGVVNVGETAARALFGSSASMYVSLAIIISILGAINSVILTAPRIYFAMARDGLFFQGAAKVHPKFKSPANSILIQAICSCLLIFSGTFGQLLTYTVVAMLTFSIMTGTANLILRKSKPYLSRPYKTHGYPFIPAAFVASYLLILANAMVSRPKEGLLGLGIVGLGIPMYFYWKRKMAVSLT
ncbi:MAG: amino acid permease [Acidobacteria bacterium]|nr:MAG: amino acid permease [Acidobacteriota bacterium]